MKSIVSALVILLIGIGILLELRYSFIVDSPVVAKLDRVSGDVWIVNNGRWVKVQPESRPPMPPPGAQQTR